MDYEVKCAVLQEKLKDVTEQLEASRLRNPPGQIQPAAWPVADSIETFRKRTRLAEARVAASHAELQKQVAVNVELRSRVDMLEALARRQAPEPQQQPATAVAVDRIDHNIAHSRKLSLAHSNECAVEPAGTAPQPDLEALRDQLRLETERRLEAVDRCHALESALDEATSARRGQQLRNQEQHATISRLQARLHETKQRASVLGLRVQQQSRQQLEVEQERQQAARVARKAMKIKAEMQSMRDRVSQLDAAAAEAVRRATREHELAARERHGRLESLAAQKQLKQQVKFLQGELRHLKRSHASLQQAAGMGRRSHRASRLVSPLPGSAKTRSKTASAPNTLPLPLAGDSETKHPPKADELHDTSSILLEEASSQLVYSDGSWSGLHPPVYSANPQKSGAGAGLASSTSASASGPFESTRRLPPLDSMGSSQSSPSAFGCLQTRSNHPLAGSPRPRAAQRQRRQNKDVAQPAPAYNCTNVVNVEPGNGTLMKSNPPADTATKSFLLPADDGAMSSLLPHDVFDQEAARQDQATGDYTVHVRPQCKTRAPPSGYPVHPGDVSVQPAMMARSRAAASGGLTAVEDAEELRQSGVNLLLGLLAKAFPDLVRGTRGVLLLAAVARGMGRLVWRRRMEQAQLHVAAAAACSDHDVHGQVVVQQGTQTSGGQAVLQQGTQTVTLDGRMCNDSEDGMVTGPGKTPRDEGVPEGPSICQNVLPVLGSPRTPRPRAPS